MRFEAVSHLLAPTQGALTAPLFGEAPASRAGERHGRAAEMPEDRETNAETERHPGRDRRWRRRSRPSPSGGQTQTEGPRQTETARTRGEREMSQADGARPESERRWGAAHGSWGIRAPTPPPGPRAARAPPRPGPPMSCEILALPHQLRLPLVGPAAGWAVAMTPQAGSGQKGEEEPRGERCVPSPSCGRRGSGTPRSAPSTPTVTKAPVDPPLPQPAPSRPPVDPAQAPQPQDEHPSPHPANSSEHHAPDTEDYTCIRPSPSR